MGKKKIPCFQVIRAQEKRSCLWALEGPCRVFWSFLPLFIAAALFIAIVHVQNGHVVKDL